MHSPKNTLSLLLYFIVSIFFMEYVLAVITVGSFFSLGYVIKLIFVVTSGTLLFAICCFFRRKASYVLSLVLLAFIALLVSSQLIYYRFFRTFYTIYSAGNVNQVSNFWRDISLEVFYNLHWLIVIFMPVIILIIWGRKMFSFGKPKYTFTIGIVCLIVNSYLFGIIAISLAGDDRHSPYDLYYKNSNPIVSTQVLGLLTTMRLDLQRLATGWSPELDVFLPPRESIDFNNPKEKLKYNVLNIDFHSLIKKEKNDAILEMHRFFSSLEPTKKNDFTGMFKGYNLIFITAESLAPYGVRKDVTPTLYKLVNEGFYFPNFYVPLWDVSTTDGEYMGLTSLIPKSGVWSFRQSANNHLPFVMGNQLRQLGYKTVAYHNHTYTYYSRNLSHPNMGYDYKGIGNGLNVKRVWPASDLEMMELSIPEFINHEPFHAYYMTVSGHLQYSFTGNSMAHKNRRYVEDLPLSNQAKAYLATQIELDRALEYLLKQLEIAGIAERTLIVMSTDHYPYGLDYETIDELSGYTVCKDFEIHKSPLIIYAKGMEAKTIERPGWGVDIIPTISNLMGIDFDSRLLMGRDLLSDSSPLVIFRNHSFITEKGTYNSITREFTPNPGYSVEQEYIEKISRIIDNKFYFSRQILDYDYYKLVWP